MENLVGVMEIVTLDEGRRREVWERVLEFYMYGMIVHVSYSGKFSYSANVYMYISLMSALYAK